MQRFYIFALLIVLSSCLNEGSVDLGSNFSFIRYYNGGADDQAMAIKETDDKGYIILANTTREDATSIKLIKTDETGNQQWKEIYTPPAITGNTNILSYKGYGLEVLKDGAGYLVTGEYINETGKSELLVIKVDAEGKNPVVKKINAAYALKGNSIVLKQNENNTTEGYVVLATISSSAIDENMALLEFNKDLSVSNPVKWSQSYGAGSADLTNKLFVKASGASTSRIYKYTWGGTVTRSGEEDMRLVRTEENKKNTDFDLPIGSPDFNERGNDICAFGFSYAMVGNTNKSATGDRDILFKLLAEDGSELASKTFPVKVQDSELPGSKTGNAITTTLDGGLLIVGTVPSNSELNFGRGGADLYLIKINAVGDVIWEKPIGSRNGEQAVAALQASDGGYIILATSDFAGLNTVMLMKTDKNGNIQ